MNGTNNVYHNVPQIPPLDVDDALQYTPLSSVVPFSPSMIMVPSFTTSGTSIFQSEAEKQHYRQPLDMLNREAMREPSSKLVRKYLHDISSHLGSVGTDLRFKSISDADIPDGYAAPSSGLLQHPGLGKFGEVVLSRSSVAFRYASQSPRTPTIGEAPTATPRQSAPPIPARSTPIQQPPYYPRHLEATVTPQPSRSSSATVTPASSSNGLSQTFQVQIPVPAPSQQNQRLQQPQQPKQSQQNQHAQQTPLAQQHEQQHALQTNGQTLHTPTLPAGPQILGAVVIKSSQDLDRTQYTKLDQQMKKSKPVGTSLSSKNRKRQRLHSDAGDDEPLSAGVDQRAKAEKLLRELKALMDSIFEAEDGLQLDTSGKTASYEHAKYWLSGTLDGENPCLSTAIQIKLESAIKNVIYVRRFGELSVDDLTRLQKLCEASLKKAETLNIIPSEEASGSALDEWLERMGLMDNALKSAKTILRTMLGGRDEKQIYSEDLLGSVINLVKYLVDETLTPMIEMRSGGEKQQTFQAAIAQKKILGGLLHELTSVFSLLSELLEREEVTEGAITTIEFITAAVVFIENANNDKESIFGVQRVELFRVAAMDILGTIFARYSDQRSFIFDEILTRLEKLPVNRVSARQFKLVDGGKNIQLVSALIMRLVQISGTHQPRKKARQLAAADEDGEEPSSRGINGNEDGDVGRNPEGTLSKLHTICNPLVDSAQKSAAYVINFIVRRAMKSTKTGDEPYRNLLDMFTEDFLTVLSLPEWPGAELLLRSLLGTMCNIIDDNKQPVTAKTMALDLLGLMGSGISDVTTYLRDAHNRDWSNEGFDNIVRLTDKYLETGGKSGVMPDFEVELLDWEGPFRIVLEHLRYLNLQDRSLRSSYGYIVTVWSARNCALFERVSESDDDTAIEVSKVSSMLKAIALDQDWDEDDDFDVGDLSAAQIKQAYALTVLNMPFCTSFEHILNRLLRSMDDQQAQCRSKGLKAINQLFSKDPAILARPHVVPFIVKKAQDASSLVRDSAIDLLGKCIVLNRDLQDQICKAILDRSGDTGVQVRKRSMKILKEIYLQSENEALRVKIAESFVHRIKDVDPGVAELAKKTFEDIWITPFYGYISEGEEEDKGTVELSPKLKLVANERVSVIVKVVHNFRNNEISTVQDVIKSLLHEDNKASGRNFRVCKTMVASMFDDLLNKQGDDEKGDRQATMQALTVFARANARLFTPDQLVMFKPYLGNLKTSDDLLLFRNVIIIYRFALPILTNRQHAFLNEVLAALLSNLAKLPSRELREVISCLWTICTIINNLTRLVTVTVSCLTNVLRMKADVMKENFEPKRLVRTIHILGLLGHFCNFEEHIQEFRSKFPQWKGNLVSGLITDTLIPFCAPNMDPSVRQTAIEGLGHVCQTYPVHFLKPQILSIFDKVFEEHDKELMNHVLLGLKGFLAREESRSEIIEAEGGVTDVKAEEDGEAGRLTTAAYANQNDGVSTSLSQKYLKNIVDIAMASQDDYALIATEVIASILRQGLVHPKECAPALVALETSTKDAISQLAFREHKTLHAKHETIVERCYMDGVRKCFEYQRNVVGDAAGAITQRWASKMRPLYDVLKDGTRRVKKKFIANFTTSIDFDPPKLDIHGSPSHVEYAVFVVENLAFFEYATLDEVLQVVTTLEKVVAATGTTVAHLIETEIFFIKLEEEVDPAEKKIDPEKLQIYSSGAGILSLAWTTRVYLRKLYGLNEQKCRDYRTNKIKAQDLNKTPTRNPAVHSNKYWDDLQLTLAGLNNEGGRMDQCHEFVDILSVDHEFKLAAENDDEEAVDAGGPGGETPELSGDEGSVAPATPSAKGRKRKNSADTPSKGPKRKKTNTKRKKSIERN